MKKPVFFNVKSKDTKNTGEIYHSTTSILNKYFAICGSNGI